MEENTILGTNEADKLIGTGSGEFILGADVFRVDDDTEFTAFDFNTIEIT